MEKLNFDSFTKKIYIKTSLEKLFWCWATKEGIESWFLSNAEYTFKNGSKRGPAEYVQVEDNYVWEWHNWDGQENGSILQSNGTDFIELSFAEVSKVSVSLKGEGDDVLLTLKQFDIPTDEKSKMEIYNGCGNGWTFWLTNLKAYLEHGILLNETKKDLRGISLSEFQFVNM